MKRQTFKEGKRLIINDINGEQNFQNYLLANGFAIGTTVTCNYSPGFSKLTNFSIKGKMISLRNSDVSKIEFAEI